MRPLKIWEEWETKKRETAIAKILLRKNLVKLHIQNVDKVESRETNIQEELFSIYVIFTFLYGGREGTTLPAFEASRFAEIFAW